MSDTFSTTMNRRTLLERVGYATTAGGLAGVAGCIGEGTENPRPASTSFRYGTTGTEQGNCLDCPDPYGVWTLADRLAEDSDGEIDMTLHGGTSICDEQSCIAQLKNGVVQTASTSIGNSTKFAPGNNIWAMAYLFPPRDRTAISYALFHEEAWQRYWVPFAAKHGIVPFVGYPAQHRVIHIGHAAGGDIEADQVTHPDDIAGHGIRRTESRMAVNAINGWGADPVSVGWGDTIQGLESGLISGLETWHTNVSAFGMLPSIDQTVMNNWSIGYQMDWASVDWLRRLPDDARELVAEHSLAVTNELAQLADEVVEQRTGATSPPPDGSPFDEYDVQVHELDDDQLAAWREPVDYRQNPDLYGKTFDEAGDILGGSDQAREFADFIWELSRENGVPDESADLEITSWWDDHLDDI